MVLSRESVFSSSYFSCFIIIINVKVKVSHDRSRWPKGFRVD